MSDTTATLPTALSGLRQRALAAWNSRNQRERRALMLAGAVLAVFAIWMTFIQPALRSIQQAPAQLDQLETQLQQMQRLAAESRELRGTAPVSQAQATAALKAATDRLGDAGKITLLGDRATLTLNGVSPEALRAWLTEARSAARARPTEVQLVRGTKGYNGNLVVNLAGTP
jgi:general secretion pathway protein M